MRKVIALLLCLLLCAVSAVAEVQSDRYFISGEELVLFERDGICMKFTGGCENIGENTFFTIVVENDSAFDLNITYKVGEDGVFRGFGSEYMAKGEATEDVMCLPVSSDIASEVTMTILVEDFEMWDELFTEEVTVLFNAERDGMVFTPDQELILIEQGGVSMAFTGVYETSETTRLYVVAENHSGNFVSIASEQGSLAMAVENGESIENWMEFACPYAEMEAMTFDIAVSDAAGNVLFEVQRPIIRFKAPLPILEKGSRGDDVQQLQWKLIELGYLQGDADGIYGGMTAEAVLAFQAAEGLPETGVADSRTQNALFAK